MTSFLLVLLASLPALTTQAKLKLEPDWTKCSIKTDCICWDKSISLMKSLYNPPTADECNIGTQNKFFTEDTAVFQFQVKGPENDDLGDNPKLIIYAANAQEEIELFGCEMSKVSKKVALVASNDFIKKYQISLFEDRSRFEKEQSLCAIKVERVLDLVRDTKYDGKKQVLKFIKTNTKTYPFEAIGNPAFQAAIAPKCDPYSFKDLSDAEGFHVLPLLNRDKDIFACKDVYGDSYTMKYKQGDQPAKDMIKLECAPENSQYLYQISEGDETSPTITRIVDPEMFTFYCAAKIDEVCEDPGLSCASPPCPAYLPGMRGRAATLTCPDKKWIIGGDLVALEAEPTCKANIISNPNDAAFFITRDSESPRIVKEGDGCFEYYDCNVQSSFVQFGKGIDHIKESGMVRCQDSKLDLSILLFDSNQTLSARNITCDKATGSWMKGGTPIKEGTIVSCYEKVEEIVVAPKHSDAQVTWMCVGIVVGCLLVTAAISYGYYFYRTHRKVVLGEDDWMKRSAEDRLAYAQDIFGKVLKAGPTSTEKIEHGMNMVAVLLDTGTEDPRIWELVYPFLMRVDGALGTMDLGMWEMHGRYLFLEAKKIIDKHGWTSKKPIRNGSQTGVIRVVAIRLLGLALDHSCSEDAHEMIEEGFRKLHFDAIEQYPHCGELWAVLLHSRVLAYKSRRWLTVIRYFEINKFTGYLADIVQQKWLKMPEEEVIPSFGQVTEQAAFALGSSQNLTYQLYNALDFALMPNSEGTALKYFSGMCLSLTHNPTACMLQSFYMIMKDNPVMLDYLRKAITEEQLSTVIDQTMRLVTYYKKGLDAKRFEQRFTPSVKQPSAMLTQLHNEQHAFETAMARDLEQLRGWYAEHTDKEELKAKPDYSTNGDFKLDNRISFGVPKLLGLDGKSIKRRSKSSSRSKSASDSHAEVASGSNRPATNPASPIETPPTQTPVAITPAPVATVPKAEPAAPAKPQA